MERSLVRDLSEGASYLRSCDAQTDEYLPIPRRNRQMRRIMEGPSIVVGRLRIAWPLSEEEYQALAAWLKKQAH